MKTLTELCGLYNSQNVLASIELFKQQCEEGYARGRALSVDASYRDIDTIVFAGMGGSALPASIFTSWNLLTKPSVVWNRYGTPRAMNEKTLFVGMSYSGTTEETLAATETALAQGAQCLGVTVGGKLAEILTSAGKPVCFIDEASNPCRQPRFAVGFMLGALVGISESLGLVTEKLDIEKVFASLGQTTSMDDKGADARLAQFLMNKIPVIVGAEHLAEVAHFFQNQLNETGKTFAIAHEIPEVNHHLLESLGNPATNKDNLVFVFMHSPYYNDRNKKRFAIMKELVEKAGIQTLVYEIQAPTWLEEAYLYMQSVEYVAYYLGLYHQCDPSDIPFVTYFKNELGK